MSQPDQSCYISKAPAEEGDEGAPFLVGLLRVPTGRARVGLMRGVNKLIGVANCEITRQGPMRVEIRLSDYQHQLLALAQIVQYLQTLQLHSGVLHGPLAADLQPILQERAAKLAQRSGWPPILRWLIP